MTLRLFQSFCVLVYNQLLFLVVIATLFSVCFATCAALGQIPPQPSPSGADAALVIQRAVTDAIATAEPSVVAIARVRKDRLQPGELLPENAGAGIRFFNNLNNTEGDPSSPDFVPTEYGSGVILTKNGLILTTYHVLGNTKRNSYYVWSQGRPFLAKVHAADPMMDLAILKVDAKDLQPIKFADKHQVQKGQIAITLSNPHAIARDGRASATWGLVSNVARRAPQIPDRNSAIRGRSTLHHFGTLIQLDAKLDLSASGGAVINLQGHMFGLTTSLTPDAKQDGPAGFAIPVDETFHRVVDQLKKGEIAEFGFLGVRPEPLSARARQAGLFGATIQSVVKGTPAAQAGLQNGDIVTAVNGQKINDDTELFRLLSSLPPQSKVDLAIVRRGADRDLDLEAFASPITQTAVLSKKFISGDRPTISQVALRFWRGAQIDYATALPAELLQERIDFLPADGCVVAAKVLPDSLAWKAGLRDGTFISHVGQFQVNNPAEFYEAVRDRDGPIRLRVTAEDDEPTVLRVPAEQKADASDSGTSPAPSTEKAS